MTKKLSKAKTVEDFNNITKLILTKLKTKKLESDCINHIQLVNKSKLTGMLAKKIAQVWYFGDPDKTAKSPNKNNEDIELKSDKHSMTKMHSKSKSMIIKIEEGTKESDSTFRSGEATL